MIGYVLIALGLSAILAGMTWICTLMAMRWPDLRMVAGAVIAGGSFAGSLVIAYMVIKEWWRVRR